MSAYLEVRDLFDSGAAQEYLGEDITIVEHMIQTAELARKANAPSWLVVAALLHDIGHLLVPDPASAQDHGVDLQHDEIGAQWIAERFSNNIVEAVRLHVDAKKYLVARNPDYLKQLSEASQITLAIQGGVFTDEQAEEFIHRPFAPESVQLRLWDDGGKVRGAANYSISDFQSQIEECAT